MDKPLSLNRQAINLETTLRNRGDLSGAVLLSKIIVKAEHEEAYSKQVFKWITKGSTLQLRDICKPFGDYWHGVEFQNIVDSIDAAHLAIRS